MKRIPSLALAAVFALALPAIAGCQQEQSPTDAADPAAALRVSFIDVGKGDCILLQAGGKAALVDTGYDSTSGKVLSYLREQGVEQLEFVLISHYDKDHISGIRAIGSELAIDAVYLPGYEGSDKHYRALTKAIGDLGLAAQQVTGRLSLALGDATVSLFPSSVPYIPDAKGNEGNDNDLSLAASLTRGNDSYLFTGDLERDGLSAFLDGKPGRFDVLKVPHHGEKSAFSGDFIEAVQPKIAVVTDSAEDPADKKVLKLLDKAGADAYRTSTSGTVVVTSDGTGRYSVSFC